MKTYRNRRKIDYWWAASKIKDVIPELKNNKNIPTEHISSHLKGTNMVFFEEEKKPVKIWMRFTLPFYVIFCTILIVSMPIFFIFTGKWGYDFNWAYNWGKSLNL